MIDWESTGGKCVFLSIYLMVKPKEIKLQLLERDGDALMVQFDFISIWIEKDWYKRDNWIHYKYNFCCFKRFSAGSEIILLNIFEHFRLHLEGWVVIGRVNKILFHIQVGPHIFVPTLPKLPIIIIWSIRILLDP